jgi:hypothetical protein
MANPGITENPGLIIANPLLSIKKQITEFLFIYKMRMENSEKIM